MEYTQTHTHTVELSQHECFCVHDLKLTKILLQIVAVRLLDLKDGKIGGFIISLAIPIFIFKIALEEERKLERI